MVEVCLDTDVPVNGLFITKYDGQLRNRIGWDPLSLPPQAEGSEQEYSVNI